MALVNSETWEKSYVTLSNRCIYKIKIFDDKIYTIELESGGKFFGKEKEKVTVIQWGIDQEGGLSFEATLAQKDFDKALYCFEGFGGNAITCEHMGKEIYFWVL